MVVADLDMALIAKRKRMMDSVGHYARPELLSLAINDRPAQTTVPMHGTHAARPQSLVPRSPDHDHHDNAAGQPAADDRTPVLRVAAG
jgi:aliphatic nitrilase